MENKYIQVKLGFSIFSWSTFQSWRQHELSLADGEKNICYWGSAYWILYYFDIRSKSGEQIKSLKSIVRWSYGFLGLEHKNTEAPSLKKRKRGVDKI